jgi:hypothetical protein
LTQRPAREVVAARAGGDQQRSRGVGPDTEHGQELRCGRGDELAELAVELDHLGVEV